MEQDVMSPVETQATEQRKLNVTQGPQSPSRRHHVHTRGRRSSPCAALDRARYTFSLLSLLFSVLLSFLFSLLGWTMVYSLRQHVGFAEERWLFTLSWMTTFCIMLLMLACGLPRRTVYHHFRHQIPVVKGENLPHEDYFISMDNEVIKRTEKTSYVFQV